MEPKYPNDSNVDAEVLLTDLRRDRDELWKSLSEVEDPTLRSQYLESLKDIRTEILNVRVHLGVNGPGDVDVQTARSSELPAKAAVAVAPSAPENLPPTVPVPRPSPNPVAAPEPKVAKGGTPEARVTSSAALILVLGAMALLAMAWLAFGRDSGDATDLETGPAISAEESVVDARAREIATFMTSQGFTDVRVEQGDNLISLIGTVPSTDALASSIGGARALAGDTPLDTDQLVVVDSSANEEDENNEDGDNEEESPPVTSPAAELQTELNRVVAATPVFFDVNQIELTGSQERVLDEVASVLASYPDVPVIVLGFTDGSGDEAANERLSLLRAENVRAYLISRGIPESGLTVQARGESSSTGSSEFAAFERRVEFEVVTTTADVAGAALKVAAIAPSPRDDLAFTESLVDAIDFIATDRENFEVVVTENLFVASEATDAFRSFASQDYDVVIAHGTEYGAGIREVALEFPDVQFIWGPTTETFGLPNLFVYDAATEEGAYVNGAMGARLSESGVLGIVAPIEFGVITRFVDGFTAGANSEAAVDVRVVYTDSFADVELAEGAARDLIADGADVLTGTSEMVTGAVAVAQEAGIPWFGNQANQAELAPDIIVASEVHHWEVALADVIDNAAAGGQPISGFFELNLANGGVVIEFNPDYDLPPEIQARGVELISQISSGAIDIPSSR